MKVILIDDDDVFNCMNQAIIERIQSDAVVEVFKSGSEVMEHINAASTMINHPDIVFLDIRMPDMDGFELLDELESIEHHPFQHAAIYMLSSTLDERDLEKAKSKSLIKGFLGKPLTVEKMREICWDLQLIS
jgi:CheY-like chemotaxis protein